MSYFNIRWGYPDAGEFPTQYGVVGINEDRLVIKLDGDSKPIILRDDQVISIRTEGSILSHNSVIIIDHIAFNAVGNVIFSPSDDSVDRLLQQIEIKGFKPKAKTVVEWNPQWGPPPTTDE